MTRQEFDAVLDMDAMERETTDDEKRVIDLAFREQYTAKTQFKRDMWARIFGSRVMPYLCTDLRSVWPM